MANLFRLVQHDADPHTVDVIITEWDESHDDRMMRSGPPPRIYLQLYELDRDGTNDDLGRIELSVLRHVSSEGFYDISASEHAIRIRYYVEEPQFVAPSGDREIGDFLRVRFQTSDPDRTPARWWEQWVPLRADPDEASERTYQVDFTFKRGREGELLAPRPPEGRTGPRRLRDRRMATIPPGGAPVAAPHAGCLVPALRDLIADYTTRMESVRGDIHDDHQRAMLCEYVVQLASQGVDDWWEHFAAWRSAADPRAERDRRRRAVESGSSALEAAVRMLLQRWSEAENDLSNHHTPQERIELLAALTDTGLTATEAGTAWAVSADGAHPVDGRIWNLVGWSNARRFPTAAAKILDRVYPAWVRLSPAVVVQGTQLRVGSFVEGHTGPGAAHLPPGVELIEEIRDGHWAINVYRINPAVRGLIRGLQHVNALLRVASFVTTMARLRVSGPGAPRSMVDAAGATIGTAGTLFQYVRFLQLSRAGVEAGVEVSVATAASRVCSRVSTGVGVGLAAWDAYENVTDDDVDAAWWNVVTGVGTIVMEVPHPIATVVGFVLVATGVVGGVLTEDSELQQWAVHGPYGTNPRNDPVEALNQIQLWLVRRVVTVSVHTSLVDPTGLTLVIELRAAGDVTRLNLTVEAHASDGGWQAAAEVNLADAPVSGMTVTRGPAGTVSVEVRCSRPGGEGVRPYSVQGHIRLVAAGLDDPDSDGPAVIHESDFFESTEVGPGMPADTGLDAGVPEGR